MRVADAAAAVRAGDLVVYPTETVYGLGADATDAAAVERVFAAKDRDRSEPLSVALPTVAAALRYVDPPPDEERLARALLPGPVTVLLPRRGDRLPDALVGGRERVGLRVPAHDRALAVLAAAGRPVTATSANVSGRPAARRVADLDDRVRERAAVVLDGGETPGGSSTVVDPGRGEILRRGPGVERVERLL
jgi:L-threonylcarbamoyladenylate synthase